MFFDLYSYNSDGLSPRKPVMTGVTFEELMEFGFSEDEILAGVSGELVRKKYELELPHEFMDDLIKETRNREIRDAIETVRYTEDHTKLSGEVARQLKISKKTVCNTIINAMDKLRRMGIDKQFQRQLTELYKLREKSGIEIEITEEVEFVVE